MTDPTFTECRIRPSFCIPCKGAASAARRCGLPRRRARRSHSCLRRCGACDRVGDVEVARLNAGVCVQCRCSRPGVRRYYADSSRCLGRLAFGDERVQGCVLRGCFVLPRPCAARSEWLQASAGPMLAWLLPGARRTQNCGDIGARHLRDLVVVALDLHAARSDAVRRQSLSLDVDDGPGRAVSELNKCSRFDSAQVQHVEPTECAHI